MSESIADLKAQLAAAEAAAKEAEAQAARARAEALRARLEAAGAAEGSAPEGTPPAPVENAAPDPGAGAAAAPGSASPGAGADAPAAPAAGSFAAMIQGAYSWDAPTITIGTLIDGGARVPGTTAKMPTAMFNRHLLVAGATGTGKTRTLQLLAEGLSAAGSSVLLCDVKGDLTGLAEAGAGSDKLLSRTAANGQEWAPAAFPVELLSLGGADSQFPGVPVRAQVSDFGPILLARALSLNTTQEQALQLIFAWADSQGLELVDLPDLRSVISFLTSEDGKDELAGIGGVSKATAGVVLRALTALESQGGGQFFGAPGFDTADLVRSDTAGRGVVSLLGVGDISSRPALVSAVIMFLLADLFSTLPEVGDVERPKLVFFFDEAHLLFSGASKAFLEAVVRTVRLIRSKGVGIVFITQSPTDVPDEVLAQLGSRVQHALRAHTPADAANLKKAVSTFPVSPVDLSRVLTSLGTGQAVVSVLDEKGRPAPVAPVVINVPAAVMGPAQDGTVSQVLASSPLKPKYATGVDNESAYELLAQRVQADAEAAEAARAAEQAAKEQAKADAAAQKALEKEAARQAAQRQKEAERLEREAVKEAQRRQREAEKAAERRQREVEKTIGSVGRQITREITRSIFGTLRRR